MKKESKEIGIQLTEKIEGFVKDAIEDARKKAYYEGYEEAYTLGYEDGYDACMVDYDIESDEDDCDGNCEGCVKNNNKGEPLCEEKKEDNDKPHKEMDDLITFIEKYCKEQGIEPGDQVKIKITVQ